MITSQENKELSKYGKNFIQNTLFQIGGFIVMQNDYGKIRLRMHHSPPGHIYIINIVAVSCGKAIS